MVCTAFACGAIFFVYSGVCALAKRKSLVLASWNVGLLANSLLWPVPRGLAAGASDAELAPLASAPPELCDGQGLLGTLATSLAIAFADLPARQGFSCA